MDTLFFIRPYGLCEFLIVFFVFIGLVSIYLILATIDITILFIEASQHSRQDRKHVGLNITFIGGTVHVSIVILERLIAFIRNESIHLAYLHYPLLLTIFMRNYILILYSFLVYYFTIF